jgi:chromosomal replication initiator protein
MPTLEERLRSRFEWGLLADIQSPDLETRNAILRSKAERMGKRVPSEIIDLIAKRVHTNIRELEGALNRVVAFSELSGVPYNTQLAEVALVDLLPQLVNISPSKLIAMVAAEWQTTVEALTGKSRTKHIAEPRQVAMYLLRHETNASLPQIGEVLGGRDHTTIMYGIEKIQGEILVKKDVERKINKIKQQLHTQAAYA